MVQHKEGGKTLRKSMIRKYGSEKAWKEHLATIGSKGGSKKGDKGFRLWDKEKLRAAGRKGGKMSRLPQRKLTELEEKIKGEADGIQ